VNYFFKSIEERDFLIRECDAVYSPHISECMCKDTSEYHVPRWEDLLNIESCRPRAMFTYSGCHVFRRSMWCAHMGRLQLDESVDTVSRSLDTIFPHVKLLAHAMVGQPAYYVGDPSVLLGMGPKDHHEYWPLFILNCLTDAIGLYETLGVNRRTIRRLREDHIKECASSLLHMLSNPTPGREDFSLRQFIWKNRKCPAALLRMFASISWPLARRKTARPLRRWWSQKRSGAL